MKTYKTFDISDELDDFFDSHFEKYEMGNNSYIFWKVEPEQPGGENTPVDKRLVELGANVGESVLLLLNW